MSLSHLYTTMRQTHSPQPATIKMSNVYKNLFSAKFDACDTL